VNITVQKKIEILRQMLLIRRFEERVKDLYNDGTIVGAIHLYIGQEAVAVGVCQALGTDDYVFSTHRGHGHAIAKTSEINRIMAELMGRETGLSGGHGGSMHLYDPARGLMGGNGIVGGGIPLALGAAFSAQYRSSDQISVAFFSDGAVNQGTFGESLNLAALFQLPVVFVCENNRYAATTPITLSVAKLDIAERALAYGVRSVSVDGNEVLAVNKAAVKAVKATRAGEGPSFIECRTYRVEPHCGIIPDQREKGERERWSEKDPILCFTSDLLGEGTISENKVKQLEKDIQSEIDSSVEFALKSPWPNAESYRHKNWEIPHA
jgi:pyruvate dehydrogenase E1 component alpha subunit